MAVDNKPWSGVHNVHAHPVKSEYTLPESSAVGGGAGGVASGDPGSILPDSSQSLPPLMHMGYAVSRHTGGVAQHGLLQQAAMCPYGQKTGW